MSSVLASNAVGSLLAGLMLVSQCVLEIPVTCVFHCAGTSRFGMFMIPSCTGSGGWTRVPILQTESKVS